VIFERSRRSTVLLGGLSALTAFGSAASGLYLYLTRESQQAAAALFLLAFAAAPVAWRMLTRLRSWPPGQLGVFRDRLVLLEGKLEQHIPWDRIETATLGSTAGWTSGRTSMINLTDRLTLRMRRWRAGHTVTFRPADFGLDPVSCRDLVLKLRDEPAARRRLPEFDSALDLSHRPKVTGELITPRL
jgi:hypothetical protein